MTSPFRFQTKSLHKHTGRQTKPWGSYLDVDVGHEHSKVGQVCAGTGGVRAVGTKKTAVLRRPEARHAALGVAPERAVWVEVLLRLLWAKSQDVAWGTQVLVAFFVLFLSVSACFLYRALCHFDRWGMNSKEQIDFLHGCPFTVSVLMLTRSFAQKKK